MQISESIDLADDLLMTLVSNEDYDETYGGLVFCEVMTRAPTRSPTVSPTPPVTPPPTVTQPMVWIREAFCDEDVADEVDSDRCQCAGSQLTNPDCSGDENALLKLDYKEQLATHSITLRKYPTIYANDIVVIYNFSVANMAELTIDSGDDDDDNDGDNSGASSSDISPWSGKFSIRFDLASASLEFSAVLDDLLEEDSEYFNFELSECYVEKSAEKCSVVYPKRFTLVVQNEDAENLVTKEEQNIVPDFLWYLLLGGTMAGGAAGFLIYTRMKNSHLMAEEGAQNQEDDALIDAIGAMDMRGDMAAVNPMFMPVPNA